MNLISMYLKVFTPEIHLDNCQNERLDTKKVKVERRQNQ